MKIDIGEVLTRAWKISWSNKSLWWFGALLILAMFGVFAMTMIPLFLPTMLGGLEKQTTSLIFVSLGIFFVLFILLFPVSAVAQAAVTLGILKAEQGAVELPSFIQLLKDAKPYLWRIVGIMAIMMALMLLLNMVVQGIMFMISLVTFGLGMMCVTPLMLLLYPIMFLAMVWTELSTNSIVVHDMSVADAGRRGWNLIRGNLLAVGLLLIVVYFGVGMVSSVVMIPLMVPFVILPLGFMEGDPHWMVIAISVLCTLVFIPIFAFFSGWSLVFNKAIWVTTYLRLTQNSDESQPAVQEVTA